MKKVVIKMVILIMMILLLPYIITMLFGEKREYYKKSEDAKLTIVDIENGKSSELNFDKYLMGVVATNISVACELETLKAQAVIMRTYTLKTIEYLESMGHSEPITTTDIGLYYVDIEETKKLWKAEDVEDNLDKIEMAVYSTKNEVITYEGELTTPLFHVTSVGKTRSSLEAFGEEHPYLTSVDSVEDVTSTDYMNITEDTIENVVRTITTNYENIEISVDKFFDEVVVEERDSLGYVKEVVIGTVSLTGEEFTKILRLNSSNFYIEDYEGKVRFICKGKGHGVGMSQFGANVMAQKGENYKNILAYYYTNTKVEINQAKKAP